jgi:CheY-like chemotaxis protein
MLTWYSQTERKQITKSQDPHGVKRGVRRLTILCYKNSMQADALPSSNRRVLIVDDNKDGRESLATVLRELGFVVQTAPDGTSALACAETFQPQVVLLDILMPGINGFQVAEKLRQHPTLSNILLISMSGFALEPDDIRWQRSGFDYHLLKPMDLFVLEPLLKGERNTVKERNTNEAA